MNNDNQKLVVSLVTTSEEFRNLIKTLFDASFKEYFKQQSSPHAVPNQDKLHTVQEAAVFFSVSTTTIHSWKNQGLLPYVKINSRIRFRHNDLLALNTNRNK